MNLNKKMSKREFLTQLVTVTGTSIVAVQMLKETAYGQEKRRGSKTEGPGKDAPGKDTDLPLVEPGKGTAAALAYHHSHADADKDSKTDKKTDKGTAWDKRFCNNCSFYTVAGDKAGKKVGKCTLFQKMLVADEGICNSWAKKV